MIELEDVSLKAGDFELKGISLKVPQGAYSVLMGRTGRGKTTLLEVICGLRQIDSGRVKIGGVDVTDWPPGDRQVGYVPQDLALFPTMTVAEHLAFALRLRRRGRAEIEDRIGSLSTVLGIDELLSRRVAGLSGGESQRVALGRALSFEPAVLLLDEPLSALDESTRAEMHTLLKSVKQETGVTTLHVTHSSEEADALADMRFTLQDGVLNMVSCGEPD